MPVGSVPERLAGNAAEADLEQLKPVARRVAPRIHQVRRRAEPRGAQEFGRALAKQAAEDVEDPAQGVSSPAEGGRKARLEQRTFGNLDLDEVVKAVVEHDLRIEDHDHVDSEEHLEHVFVQIEIDRRRRLRVGSGEIEDHLRSLAVHRTFDLVRSITDAVVADVIGKADLVGADRILDESLHRAVVAVEQRPGRGDINIVAEARAHLVDPTRGDPARSDQRVKVGRAPIGLARLVHHQLDQIFVVLALGVDLDRRDAHAFLKDGAGVDRHRSGDLAADIRLVAEHRGPRDQPPAAENRQQYQPVVRMADRPFAAVGIAEEDHVAFLDRPVEAFQEPADEAAELAHDHLAGGVGDQRKGVALLADARRHGGADQRRVHLDPRVAKRILDDVERHRIDHNRVERGGVALNDLGRHQRASGVMRILPWSSTAAVWPDRINVVESISVMTAGPLIWSPARSLARSYITASCSRPSIHTLWS